MTLDQALRVPKALADHYACRPQKPLAIAQALGMTPSSGTFRALCGAAIGYGLTDGGANSAQISLSDLGKRIVSPLKEGDDTAARRDAFLSPRVVGDFLRQYDQAKLPRPDIGRNVLLEMKVPRDAAERTYTLIAEGASEEGLIREIKGERFVDLTGVADRKVPADSAEPNGATLGLKGNQDAGDEPDSDALSNDRESPIEARGPNDSSRGSDGARLRRVFIAHGKNTSFLEPIKKLLSFGELEPVVSVERSSVSIPIPEKVMRDMRSCGAAIIHVDAEQTLIDPQANEHTVLNSNVLVEIGAALALFDRRFILLVRDGIKLPSNLAGLHEVRYTGETLDGTATIRLLEAINDIKNHPLPIV